MNTTTRILLLASLFSAPLAAQGERLQRAILIEEQERNVKQAAKLYEEIAEAKATNAADRTVAWYRLGRALRRLGREAEARGAFGKAAKGKGPTAAAAKQLLSAGEGQSQKEKELRASARKILDTQPSNMQEGLLWIGEAAIPEICAKHERDWRTGNGSLADLVWKIGGKRAEAFLANVLAEGDPRFKETIAASVPQNFHPGLLEPALRFLEDESLSAKSAIALANRILRSAPLARLGKLTASKRTAFASELWGLLGDKLSRVSRNEERAKAFTILEPWLGKSLNGADAAVAASAGQFLRSWGMLTRSGFDLVRERITAWPREVQISFYGGAYSVDAPTLLTIARDLGPWNSRDNRAAWLLTVTSWTLGNWKSEDLDTVLDLTKLGYVNSLNTWLQESKAHVKRGSHIVEAFADTRHLASVATMLIRVDLEPSVLPILLRAYERTKNYRTELLYCMGRTGAEDALAFLIGKLSDPATHDDAAGALRYFSYRRDTPESRAALRTAIREALALRPQRIVRRLVERLIEIGDLEVLKMLPDIGEFGLARSSSSRSRSDTKSYVVQNMLKEWWNPQENRHESSHGLDANQIAAAWKIVLDQGPAYWDFGILQPSGEAANVHGLRIAKASRARPSIVAMLVEKFDSRITDAKNPQGSLSLSQRNVLANLLNLPDSWRLANEGAIRALRALRLRALRSGDRSYQLAALSAVLGFPAPSAGPGATRRPDLDRAERTEVLRLFRATDEQAAAAAFRIVRERIVLTDAEFTDLLQNGGSFVRRMLLESYLDSWKGEVAIDAVVPSLGDSNSTVRLMVCKYLGRRADTAAVTPLLKVLRDPIESVRKAARQALQDIRFFHEQQAHWARMSQGARTDANSAAEKLVQQAGPKEEKKVRLLAIRSLGLLGKVEAVPFLIEFSKEKDAEIAAAAKQAIETIHQKAARVK